MEKCSLCRLNKLKKNWSFITILVLVGFIILFSFQHEFTHQVICQEFGGRPTTIMFNFTEMSSYVLCNGNFTENQVLAHANAQANVEAFGYQLSLSVIFLIGLIMALGSLLVELKKTGYVHNHESLIEVKENVP